MWRRIVNLDCSRRSLRSNRFLNPFQPGIEHANEKVGERRTTPGVSKILGRSGEAVSEKGEIVGAEKRNRLQSIPNVLLNSVRP